MYKRIIANDTTCEISAIHNENMLSLILVALNTSQIHSNSYPNISVWQSIKCSMYSGYGFILKYVDV